MSILDMLDSMLRINFVSPKQRRTAGRSYVELREWLVNNRPEVIDMIADIYTSGLGEYRKSLTLTLERVKVLELENRRLSNKKRRRSETLLAHESELAAKDERIRDLEFRIKMMKHFRDNPSELPQVDSWVKKEED